MYKWLLCLALIGCVSGCNILQRLKVKNQWQEAFGYADDRTSLGTALWRSIIMQKPESVDKFFKRVNGKDISSPAFQAHIQRVFGGFDMCISMLDDSDVLASQLAHLHAQHVERGISAEYFDVFAESLMLAVESTIESCFDKDAWSQCTKVISSGIGSGV